MSLIRKVAVLGSGVMGSGIAAHVANAGIPVLMLDIVPPKPGPGDARPARPSATSSPSAVWPTFASSGPPRSSRPRPWS